MSEPTPDEIEEMQAGAIEEFEAKALAEDFHAAEVRPHESPRPYRELYLPKGRRAQSQDFSQIDTWEFPDATPDYYLIATYIRDLLISNLRCHAVVGAMNAGVGVYVYLGQSPHVRATIYCVDETLWLNIKQVAPPYYYLTNDFYAQFYLTDPTCFDEIVTTLRERVSKY